MNKVSVKKEPDECRSFAHFRGDSSVRGQDRFFCHVRRSKTTKTKKRPDFQSFLDDVVKDIPSHQEIYVILDNYCTHKRNDEWLAGHPNVYFHFTPTSASWLNQVEIWFGILTRKALKGASFNSVDDLKQAIQDFC